LTAIEGSSATPGPTFTVGAVLRTGISVALAHFFRFVAVLLIVAVPVIVVSFGIMTLLGNVTINGLNFTATLDGPKSLQILTACVIGLLGVLATFLFIGALTCGTLQHLRGQPVLIGACLSNGFAALPGILGAGLVLLLGVGVVGMVTAMFVGGILAAMGAEIWLINLVLGLGFLLIVSWLWVFVPAIIAERAGALHSLGRSMELTRGHRRAVFGILVLIAIANWIVPLLSGSLASVSFVAGAVLNLASGVFFVVLNPVMAAVGYAYLRSEKEGVALVEIFKAFG
jgi:hypothetical protein